MLFTSAKFVGSEEYFLKDSEHPSALFIWTCHPSPFCQITPFFPLLIYLKVHNIKEYFFVSSSSSPSPSQSINHNTIILIFLHLENCCYFKYPCPHFQKSMEKIQLLLLFHHKYFWKYRSFCPKSRNTWKTCKKLWRHKLENCTWTDFWNTAFHCQCYCSKQTKCSFVKFRQPLKSLTAGTPGEILTYSNNNSLKKKKKKSKMLSFVGLFNPSKLTKTHTALCQTTIQLQTSSVLLNLLQIVYFRMTTFPLSSQMSRQREIRQPVATYLHVSTSQSWY